MAPRIHATGSPVRCTVRAPGLGWRRIGGAIYQHTSGLRVHLLGYAFLLDGTVRSASAWPESRLANAYIRLAGGNRKRGLMMWALASTDDTDNATNHAVAASDSTSVNSEPATRGHPMVIYDE